MLYQAVDEIGDVVFDPPPPELVLAATTGSTTIPLELIFISQVEYSLASACRVMRFADIDWFVE